MGNSPSAGIQLRPRFDPLRALIFPLIIFGNLPNSKIVERLTLTNWFVWNVYNLYCFLFFLGLHEELRAVDKRSLQGDMLPPAVTFALLSRRPSVFSFTMLGANLAVILVLFAKLAVSDNLGKFIKN